MSHLPVSPRTTAVEVLETTVEYLQHDRDQLIAESDAAAVGRLELALEDIGWNRLVAHASTEFSRAGLERITILSRLMWRKNPLIRRAVNVRTYYTWAQGVTVRARDEQLNEIVQGFYADPQNQIAVFGHEAAETLDRSLATDGNLVFVLVTAPVSGWVQVRTIPWTELAEPVKNPDDRADVWYWLRRYTDADGTVVEQLHPDVDHIPSGVRPSRHDGLPIIWNQPVLVVTVDRLDGETWGVPEVYAALDWARAYKEFLEDWASYVKALAEFAWRHKTKTGAAAKRVQATHEEPRTDRETGTRRSAGATAVGTSVDGLEPIKHSGAHVDADSGRQLAIMVGAAMDLPYTILTGDADNSNLATAQTLDRPMELALTSRRRRWADVYRRMCRYVIETAVKAPRGVLSGTVSRDEWGRTVVTLAGDVDLTIDVDFPPLVEHDLKDYVESIKFATEAMPDLPPDVTVRLLLTAFGVDDVDEHVDEVAELAAAARTREDATAVAEAYVAQVLEAEVAKIREAA